MKYLFILTCSVLIFFSCNKETPLSGSIEITTDKEVYKTGDTIIYEVNNLTNSIASYSWGSMSNFLPDLYKFEDNSWIIYWGQICNEYNCYCCNELLLESSLIDTFVFDFENGIYRMGITFTMEATAKRNIYYSNSFTFY